MSNDLNQCNFIGRLGKPIELRYMPDGGAVASFSLAVGWKGKSAEGTEWVNITAFGKLAEIMGQYLTKGSKVFISGRMKTEKWQDAGGNDKYSTKIIANQMQMLDSRAPEQRQQDPAQSGMPAEFDDETIPF